MIDTDDLLVSLLLTSLHICRTKPQNSVSTFFALVQGLNEINPQAAEIEEKNALALAIYPPGRDKKNNILLF